MLDIDHFKAINDQPCHAIGDEALRSVADVVRVCERGADVFGRIGGEEFAVILPDTDIDGAEAFAERLRAQLAARRLSRTASSRPRRATYHARPHRCDQRLLGETAAAFA